MTVTSKINGDHFKERRETDDLVQPKPVVEVVAWIRIRGNPAPEIS
jgi:hypothetical protein